MEQSRTQILHVTHNMGFGGTEQVIRQIISACDDSLYKSGIVCIDGTVGEIGQAMQDNDVSVFSISRGIGLDRQAIAQLRALIRNNRIDILHCHQYTPFCYGAFASMGLSTQVIFTEHGRFHPDRFTWKRRLVNQILYRLADDITCISNATRLALDQFEWIPKKRTQVIYNGVSALVPDVSAKPVRHRLGIPDTAWVLGTISRLDPIKNQLMMLEALGQMRRQYPDMVLMIVGDGPERKTLEATVKKLDIADSVYFTGFVTDIAEHLQAIDIFLLTSFSEGTSMTLLEAMSMGKVIIATAVGGNVEVVDDGHSGELIPSDDVQALVEKLMKLHGNESALDNLSRGATKRYRERFSVQTMVQQYEALYQRKTRPL